MIKLFCTTTIFSFFIWGGVKLSRTLFKDDIDLQNATWVFIGACLVIFSLILGVFGGAPAPE